MKIRTAGIFSVIFLLATLFAGVYLVGIKTGFIKKAFGTPANLIIDLGSSFANPGDCWRSLAQGGESRGRMIAPAISEVKKLQPQYIRIDHIYDNYNVVRRDGGQLAFNWQELDLIIQDILATGAKPFLSLSYMPPAISKDGNVDSVPTNWVEWQIVVQKTIEHVSGKGGLNLSGVYYEVWNEPDLFGRFKAGGDKNYLDLYYYAQLGAKSARGVNSFKIGGPATTGLYKSWIDALLLMAQSGKIRLDFLSWHNYSRDIDKYDENIQNIAEWVSAYPNYSNIELVVSELGINSENDPAYDGNLSAIHTLASASVLQTNVNKCFNFEIIDGAGPEKLWGRWGLLTNEKFGAPTPKTRFYAIQFLNRMVGERISVGGSGSWVKAFGRNQGNKFKILVVNYDPTGKHGEVVPFNLINLPYRKFTIKRIDFLGGSSTQTVDIDTPNWSTDMAFSPNSASIFEIEPI
jgi:hypothetical protein